MKKLSRIPFDRSEKRKQEAKVLFRLYDEEIGKAEQFAAEMGASSVPKLCKYLLMNAERLGFRELSEKDKQQQLLQENLLKAINELLRQISGMGTNLNQMAFRVNQDTNQNEYLSQVKLDRINQEIRDSHLALNQVKREVRKIHDDIYESTRKKTSTWQTSES